MCQRFLLTGVLLAAANLAAPADPPRVPYPPPDRPRPAVGQGVVTAVDKESITVRGFDVRYMSDGDRRHTTTVSDDRQSGAIDGPHLVVFGQEGMYGAENRTLRCVRSEGTPDTLTLYPADGGDPIVMKLADQPERKFFLTGPLAEGGYKKGVSHAHRLADVQVGDRVSVEGVRRGAVEYAETVTVWGRPYGRVPPTATESDKPPLPGIPWFHEYRNAEQDLAERGIPLPEGYHKHVRWVHPAPPPREVKPKPLAP
jgi:hypothetical protein